MTIFYLPLNPFTVLYSPSGSVNSFQVLTDSCSLSHLPAVFLCLFFSAADRDYYNMSVHGLQKILDSFPLNRHFLPEAPGLSCQNINLEQLVLEHLA